MTEMQMYWLLKMDDVRGLLEAMVMISFISSILFGIICGSLHGDSDQKAFKLSLTIAIISLFLVPGSLIIRTFIPSTKQLAAIMVVPKLTNAIEQNEKLMQMPNKLLDLADDWIEELKPNEKSDE